MQVISRIKYLSFLIFHSPNLKYLSACPTRYREPVTQIKSVDDADDNPIAIASCGVLWVFQPCLCVCRLGATSTLSSTVTCHEDTEE